PSGRWPTLRTVRPAVIQAVLARVQEQDPAPALRVLGVRRPHQVLDPATEEPTHRVRCGLTPTAIPETLKTGSNNHTHARPDLLSYQLQELATEARALTELATRHSGILPLLLTTRLLMEINNLTAARATRPSHCGG